MRVPQEIVQLIFEELGLEFIKDQPLYLEYRLIRYDARDALATSLFVNRDLRHYALTWLFRQVILKVCHKREITTSRDSLARFRNILVLSPGAQSLDEVGQYVKSIYFRFDRNDFGGDVFEEHTVDTFYHHPDFAFVIHKLCEAGCRVDSLKLVNRTTSTSDTLLDSVGWNDLHPSLQTDLALLINSPSLKNLLIDGIKLPLDILSRSTVTNLQLTDFNSQPSYRPNSLYDCPLTVETLHIDFTFQYKNPSIVFRNLTALTVECHSLEDLIAAKEIVKCASESLQKLDFIGKYHFHVMHQMEFLTLSKSLKFYTGSLPLGTNGIDHMPDIDPWDIRRLKNVTNKLQSLELLFNVVCLSDWDALKAQWLAVDSFLHTWKNLEVIQIVVYISEQVNEEDDEEEVVEKTIAEHLPQLVASKKEVEIIIFI